MYSILHKNPKTVFIPLGGLLYYYTVGHYTTTDLIKFETLNATNCHQCENQKLSMVDIIIVRRPSNSLIKHISVCRERSVPTPTIRCTTRRRWPVNKASTVGTAGFKSSRSMYVLNTAVRHVTAGFIIWIWLLGSRNCFVDRQNYSRGLFRFLFIFPLAI